MSHHQDLEGILQTLLQAESKVVTTLRTLSKDVDDAAVALKIWADRERGKLPGVSHALRGLLTLYADALQDLASQSENLHADIKFIAADSIKTKSNSSREAVIVRWLSSKFKSLFECSEKATIVASFGQCIVSGVLEAKDDEGLSPEALLDEAFEQITQVGKAVSKAQVLPDQLSPLHLQVEPVTAVTSPMTLSGLSPTLPPWLFRSPVNPRACLPPLETSGLTVPASVSPRATPNDITAKKVGVQWDQGTSSPDVQGLSSPNPRIQGKLKDNVITGGNNVNVATAGRDVHIYNGNKDMDEGKVLDKPLSCGVAYDDTRAEELNFLEWVSRIDSKAVQWSIFDKVTPGTGAWFLNSSRYDEWVNSPKMRLWGAGDPGAGKTFLSSIIINALEELAKQDASITVIYVYCRFEEHFTTPQVFATLLRQLAEHSKTVFETAKDKLYTTTLRQGRARTPTLTQLLDVIMEGLQEFTKTYIILDALDELDPPVRHEVVKILQSRFETPILLTSRLTDLPHGISVDFEIRPPAEDIHAFVRYEISNSGRIELILSRRSDSESILNEVSKKVENASDGLFLIATFHVTDLKKAENIQALKEIADCLPQGGIDVMYEKSIARIDSQTGDTKRTAYLTIAWILYAIKPLNLRELLEALAVKPGSKSINWDDALMEGDIVLSNCYGLVRYEPATDSLRFIHITAQDYLQKMSEALKEVFCPTPYRFMADVCSTYITLILPVDRLPRESLMAKFAARPFLDHACRYVGSYIRLTIGPSQDQDDPGSVLAQVLQYIPPELRQYSHLPLLTNSSTIDQGSLAHLAALSGVTVLLKWELASGADVSKVNEESEEGMTPLFYAVIGGHVPCVKYLLTLSSIDVSHKARNGQTALTVSSMENGEEVQKILTAHQSHSSSI